MAWVAFFMLSGHASAAHKRKLKPSSLVVQQVNLWHSINQHNNTLWFSHATIIHYDVARPQRKASDRKRRSMRRQEENNFPPTKLLSIWSTLQTMALNIMQTSQVMDSHLICTHWQSVVLSWHPTGTVSSTLKESIFYDAHNYQTSRSGLWLFQPFPSPGTKYPKVLSTVKHASIQPASSISSSICC